MANTPKLENSVFVPYGKQSLFALKLYVLFMVLQGISDFIPEPGMETTPNLERVQFVVLLYLAKEE